MSSKTYGRKLDPFRTFKEPFGVKGSRQTVVIPNNPTTIAANEQLFIRFPKLDPHDVIVPGTVRLAFNISLTSEDADRTLVQNRGRALIKKLTIRMNGTEIMSLDNADLFYCYLDMWNPKHVRDDGLYQGIDTSNNRNITKLRIGAQSARRVQPDFAISEVLGNRFHIPLDFELLSTTAPFHQSSLSDQLEYQITFNDYSDVINTSEGASATYNIQNICLEYEKVTDQRLAEAIRSQYGRDKKVIFYERVLRYTTQRKCKSDKMWNFGINVPARSMKGILMLFKEPESPFSRNTEVFYNPKIEKVSVTIEGVPNKLFSQGMLPYQHWDEIKKYFSSSPGIKILEPIASKVIKDLCLADVSFGEYLTKKYALWLDLRTTDDEELHGSGLSLEKLSQGICLDIEKKVESEGPIDVYMYIIYDAQINFQDTRLSDVIY